MEAESREKRQVSIEITQGNEDLVSSIKGKMENFSLRHSICRVPDKLIHQNKENYSPTLVSIGPFHHGEGNLKSMEDHKWRYLNTLLSRTPNIGATDKCVEDHKWPYLNTLLTPKPKVEATLDKCVNTIRGLEQKARKCYGENLQLGSNEFVQMMLLDGCFIIELFLKISIKSLRRRDDTFLNSHEKFFHLRCDMILLENQIPFFILCELFSLVPIPKQCTQSLTELALRFFKNMIYGDFQVLQEKFGQDFNHLLDLVHQCYLPTYIQELSDGAVNNMNNATKLQAAGISITKLPTESPLNIHFSNGVLKIPPLKIQRQTEILFRNFIAMEHYYHNNCSKYVTSYVFLLRCLIQTEKDDKLIRKRQILADFEKEEKEIMALLKKIHVEVDVNEFYYRGLCHQVEKYGENVQMVWYQNIKRFVAKLTGMEKKEGNNGSRK